MTPQFFARVPVSAPAPAFPEASALPHPDARDTFVTIATRSEFAGHRVEVRLRPFTSFATQRNATRRTHALPLAELTSTEIIANNGGAFSPLSPLRKSTPCTALNTADLRRPSSFPACCAPAQSPPVVGAVQTQPAFGAAPLYVRRRPSANPAPRARNFR
ncbi:hypothetical protein K438DRAFT_1985817 [Mycena galopus ATCC 62051]|nr:hypothetical protein K438DRAFT_1985817 [Mycena galopus ATCC 62051]